MIEITSNAKDIANWIKHLTVNIQRSQSKLAEELGKVGKYSVENRAPIWKGTLKQRVAMKMFMQSHKAEIMMASPHYNDVALQNEFNIYGRRKLYKSAYPKLGEWANDKGIFLDKPFVIVGGRGTHLGNQNIFFEPAFKDIIGWIPYISEVVISEAVRKTGG
jgi:hypothetical protein